MIRRFLGAVAYVGRGFIADVLEVASARVRPPEDQPAWMQTAVDEYVATQLDVNVRAGGVTLSPTAQRMRDEGAAGDPPPAKNEHEPEKPLKGSLAWRQQQQRKATG